MSVTVIPNLHELTTPGRRPIICNHVSVSTSGAVQPDFEARARELGLLDGNAARRLHFLRDGFIGGGRWAIFIGAGVSRGSGLLDWDQLTRQLANLYGVECPKKPADNAFPSIIEECMRRAPTEAHFWDTVADSVCRGEPSEMHELLMQLPFEACLTTNFDCLLEGPHQALADVAYPSIVSYPTLRAPDVGGRRLVHLHGRCDHGGSGPRLTEASTVFTQSGYDRAYNTSGLATAIEGAIETYSLLFVGASLGDWQIRLLLSRVRDRARVAASLPNGPTAPRVRGFALVESDGTETGAAADWTWPGKALGIEAIFYNNLDGSHTALRNAVRWLVRETGGISSANQYEVAP